MYKKRLDLEQQRGKGEEKGGGEERRALRGLQPEGGQLVSAPRSSFPGHTHLVVGLWLPVYHRWFLDWTADKFNLKLG